LTISLTDLQTALLDLLYETREEDLRLIIGGGYGIYLKREYLRQTGERTLFKEWPEARSTNDLDLFLRPELLIASEPLKPLRDALATLDYEVVPTAEKYQFAKPGPTGGREGALKVDLLTGPQSSFKGTKAKADSRRVRPNPSADLHAHPVNEAITLEDGLLKLPIDGKTSSGPTHRADVYVPHPLTFAMMKLFAFRDRGGDPDKEYGRYHALDVYSVLAMATELEWEQAIELSKRHQNESAFKEAVQIVHDYFSSMTSLGMIRMQESPYCRPQMQLDQFVSVLSELFPSGNP
jgi:Nucleotidyltransferase